jgi:hypothetical protein
MALHRRAAMRDGNEPELRAAFARHGWHTETMSGTGMPDLLVWPPESKIGSARLATLVDVKNGKGRLKPAQATKWKALSEKGIPVYVCRTEADVDALVRGDLQPWAPWEDEVRRIGRDAKRGLRKSSGMEGSHKLGTNSGAAPGHAVHVTSSGYDPANPPRGDVDVRTRLPGKVRKEWRPPQATPVDAAKEAAETFAPPGVVQCVRAGCNELAAFGTAWCPEHTP